MELGCQAAMAAEVVIVILSAADKWLLNHLANSLSSRNFSLKNFA